MLRMAAGSVDISPSRPLQMGCGDDRTPTADVRDPIEANALVLRDHNTSVALISVDALYAGAPLRNRLEEGLADLLNPAEIFVGASHTHYAPFLDSNKPMLGGVDAEHAATVARRIVALTRSLLGNSGEPATVEFARFATSAAIIRRRRRLIGGAEGKVLVNSTVAAPNRAATKPQTGHLLRFSTADGPAAFVWQLACHPTSLPIGSGHSAHFPGSVRAHLRSHMGNDVLPVLFFQGFSGDLRPPAEGRVSGPKSLARRLLLGRWFASFSEADYSRWLNAIQSEVEGGLGALEPISSTMHGSLSTSRITMRSGDLAKNSVRPDADVSWHRVSFGAIDLVGMSAEPVAKYAESLAKQTVGTGRVCIPVGCIDDVFGYVPTNQMLPEGGYEVSGFCKSFGIDALRPGIEGVVNDRFTQVLQID